MKKSDNGLKIFALIVLVIALFAGVTVWTSSETYRKNWAAHTEQPEQEEEEQTEESEFKELDTYTMQEFCKQNADAVFTALKDGDEAQLESLMIDADGAASVMEYADWTDADFGKAISMGSGSLTVNPDEEGRMDVSERFFVTTGGTKYVFFIETRCSKMGRVNDGVSAIGVTTFSHFDAVDYTWNGEKDDTSVLAGSLFWKR